MFPNVILYLIYIGRRVVTLPSQRRDNIRFEKSRIVHLQFETNLIEKISTDKWPCEQDLRNDYCLESVVETESKCYLPWGLGIGAGIYYYIFLLNKLFFYIYWNSDIIVGWKVFVGTLTYLINVEDGINREGGILFIGSEMQGRWQLLFITWKLCEGEHNKRNPLFIR